MTGPAPLASAEVLRQVRRLDLRTRRVVDTRFAGEYRSVFKGQGLEFAEVREYQPGDEVRAIDWNVSARMGRPFVKRFEEERELTVLFVVDVSASAGFGSGARTKLDLARELVAVLALTAVRHNDRVGLVLFSDRVELVLPPRKGRRQALRVLRELVRCATVRRGTALAPVADTLARLLSHRAVVFLVSDFQEGGAEAPLARLAQRHDLVAVTVQDPAERRLPDVGPARFEDPETGARVVVDTSDPSVRAAFDREVAAADAARERLLARLGVDEVRIQVEHGYLEPLRELFAARLRRRHGVVRVASRAARRALGVVALAAGALLAGAEVTAQPAPQAGGGAPAGSAGALAPVVRVRPETVTVGDPFEVEITVPLPAGRVVRWPAGGDSTASVAARGAAIVTVAPRSFGGQVERARLPMAAWVTGTVPLTLGSVEVANGTTRWELPLPAASVVVQSVLPLDTAAHRPLPPRPPFPRVLPWWERWGAAAAVAAALALLAWAWRRRRRRAAAARGRGSAPDPLEVAREAFRRLDRMALADAGEGAPHVGAAVDIVRRYLASRFPDASVALTSAELLTVLGADPRVPGPRLMSLLAEGDRVKYAPRAVDAAQARAFALEARGVVEAVEDAVGQAAARARRGEGGA